jgi:hypothetical protein
METLEVIMVEVVVELSDIQQHLEVHHQVEQVLLV